MSDEKKTERDIITVSAGSSIAANKIGLGDAAYKNGGVPAQFSADWQHTTFDLRTMPHSRVSTLASVSGTVVAPPSAANPQSNPLLDNIVPTRPPAVVGEASLGMLYSQTPPAGQAGIVATVFVGAGVRQSIPLATGVIEGGKKEIVAQLEGAVQAKAAAQRQITEAQEQITEGLKALQALTLQSISQMQPSSLPVSLPTSAPALPEGTQQKIDQLAAAQVALDAVHLPDPVATRDLIDAATYLPKGLQPYAEASGRLGVALPIGGYLESQITGHVAGEIGTNSNAHAEAARLAIGHRMGGLPTGLLRANPEAPEHNYIPDPSQTGAGAWKIEGAVSQHHIKQSPYLPVALTQPEVTAYGVSAAIAASRKVIFSAGVSVSDNPSMGVVLPEFVKSQGIDTQGPKQDMSAKVGITIRF